MSKVNIDFKIVGTSKLIRSLDVLSDRVADRIVKTGMRKVARETQKDILGRVKSIPRTAKRRGGTKFVPRLAKARLTRYYSKNRFRAFTKRKKGIHGYTIHLPPREEIGIPLDARRSQYFPAHIEFVWHSYLRAGLFARRQAKVRMLEQSILSSIKREAKRTAKKVKEIKLGGIT